MNDNHSSIFLRLGVLLSLLIPLLTIPNHLAAQRERVLLSVQQFEPIGTDQSLAATVTELLRNELARSSRLSVLEETGRLYRIQRSSVRWRDLFSEGSLRRIGELLESRYVLTGSVARPGESIIMAARIVDAESGEVLAAETVEHSGGVNSITAGVSRLAGQVLAWFPLAGRVTGQRGDTLIADIGLDDGVLPGQEVTVADLQPGERGLESRRVRSARYRVEKLESASCELVPLVSGAARWLGTGATVISPGGTEDLLEKSQLGEEITGLDRGGFGSVSIVSDPPGALAIVAGLDVGRTPVRVPQLASGRHELVLALEGYEEVWDSILAVPGETKEYSYTMDRATGRLTIVTSQSDVSLRVDTLELQLQGSATVTLEDFPAGEHHITARKPGYETWRRKVDIDFRADSIIEIELAPHPGSVLVTSQPSGADVFLDGTFQGKTTPWRMVRLEPGPHVVRASLPGHGSAVDTVQVVPGEDITTELQIRQGWFGYIPAGMQLVPGETIVFGDGDTVDVDSFYIDRHEVTNRQYSYFVESTERKAPRHWPEGKVPEGMEDHPVVNVSYQDAAAYAAWCGKRLPTELEWELAAMGPEEQKYPWGGNYSPGMANIWSEGLGETCAVDEYPRDKSVYGVIGMAGNVAEWVDGWSDRERTYRVFRGGSFYVNQDDPSLFSRDGLYPVSGNSYVGFRCARNLHVQR